MLTHLHSTQALLFETSTFTFLNPWVAIDRKIRPQRNTKGWTHLFVISNFLFELKSFTEQNTKNSSKRFFKSFHFKQQGDLPLFIDPIQLYSDHFDYFA